MIKRCFSKLRTKQPHKLTKLGVVSKQMVVSENSGLELPTHTFSGVDKASYGQHSVFKIGSKDLENMRLSCKLAAEILEFGCSLVSNGVTTDEIDQKVFEYATQVLKVYPSPLNYMKFPKSLCTSVNEVLCHGIPDDRKLENGDIINLDVSAFKNGLHGDTSRTVIVGNENDNECSLTFDLLQATKEALNESIKICGPGVEIGKIAEICDVIGEKHGFSVDDTFCGHGNGSSFHMAPLVRHTMRAYGDARSEQDRAFAMKPGLVFTIEPILVAGEVGSRVLEDGWTVVSSSNALSAQFEHTILITDNGAEVLTQL